MAKGRKEEVRYKAPVVLEYTFWCSACDATAKESQVFNNMPDQPMRPSAPAGWTNFGPVIFCEKHLVQFDVRRMGKF